MSKELEDRFHRYAKGVRDFCTKVKWNIIKPGVYQTSNTVQRFYKC